MWARSNSSCLENLTEKSLNNILRDHSQSPSKRGANPGSWKRKRQHPSSPFARVISHIFLVSYPSGRHFPCSVLIPSLSRLSRDMVRAPACVCVCLKGRSFNQKQLSPLTPKPAQYMVLLFCDTDLLFILQNVVILLERPRTLEKDDPGSLK